MSEFCFEFEQTPLEATLNTLRVGDALCAVRFLALLEGEDEAAVEDALQTLEERMITLDISKLPRDYGSVQLETRLRTEEALVSSGKLPQGLDSGDPLRLYLEEIAATPCAGDPQVLAQQYRDGDDSAAEQLLHATVSLAIQKAQEMTGRGVLLLDLIQEASLGLWQSIRHYTGGDFITHAQWWIHQYLTKAVTLQARANGVGRKMRDALEDYRAADKALLTELGRNPTMEEIALRLNITAQEAEIYEDMLRAARAVEQAKQPPQENEEEDQAVEDTAYFQSRQRILDMLSTLDAVEVEVLTLRFGLEGGLPCTPEQTGQKLGLSPDRVIQLESAALAKLRNEV